MGSSPEGNTYSQKLIGDRYAQRGTQETTSDIFRRIAHQVVQSPCVLETDRAGLEEQFYNWMSSGALCPAGRILANCGGTGSNMNGNCFALPIHDSRESIYRALGEMSEIEAYGGGVGFNFSELRPAGWEIKKLNGVSSGPVAFIDIFDKSVGTISQGGSRRGAAIGVLNIDHPDVLSFIHAKSDPENRRWTNFNVSVGLTDAFMKAVKANQSFHYRWGDWVDPTPQSAHQLFREIAEAAWATGEPGVFFLDTVNQRNPLSNVEVLQAVNPCGELPLSPYGMCALASLNLSVFVDSQGRVLWERLEKAVRAGVRFLDLLIDTTFFPLPEIREEVFSKRKIGLGVFGLADMLFLKGLPYGKHPETISFLHRLFGRIEQAALSASECLAMESGPFPLWDQVGLPDETPRRNGTLLSMAPTGSISSLYGASWGIEPYFAISMVRNERMGVDQVSFRVLEQWRKEHPDQEWPDHLKLVHSENDSRVLSVEDHLAVLSVVASHVDNAVSKTVNLPRTASVEDVESAFMHAWELGIKGLTVFRDQCKRAAAITPVVEETDMEDDLFDDDEGEDDEMLARDAEVIELAESMVEDILSKPKDRPDTVSATTYHIKYAPDKPALYITIGDVDEDPFEIFINTEDSLMREGLDGLSLTLTALFRRGISCKFLVEKFLKYESAMGGAFYKGKYVPSVLAAVGLVLKEHLQGLGAFPLDKKPELLRSMGENASQVHADRCPSCSEYAYVRQDGCGVCAACGFSSCG